MPALILWLVGGGIAAAGAGVLAKGTGDAVKETGNTALKLAVAAGVGFFVLKKMKVI